MSNQQPATSAAPTAGPDPINGLMAEVTRTSCLAMKVILERHIKTGDGVAPAYGHLVDGTAEKTNRDKGVQVIEGINSGKGVYFRLPVECKQSLPANPKDCAHRLLSWIYKHAVVHRKLEEAEARLQAIIAERTLNDMRQQVRQQVASRVNPPIAPAPPAALPPLPARQHGAGNTTAQPPQPPHPPTTAGLNIRARPTAHPAVLPPQVVRAGAEPQDNRAKVGSKRKRDLETNLEILKLKKEKRDAEYKLEEALIKREIGLAGDDK